MRYVDGVEGYDMSRGTKTDRNVDHSDPCRVSVSGVLNHDEDVDYGI